MERRCLRGEHTIVDSIEEASEDPFERRRLRTKAARVAASLSKAEVVGDRGEFEECDYMKEISKEKEASNLWDDEENSHEHEVLAKGSMGSCKENARWPSHGEEVPSVKDMVEECSDLAEDEDDPYKGEDDVANR
jgi:hypothetical protein